METEQDHLTPEEDLEEVSEKLMRIEERTRSDGTAWATIQDVWENGANRLAVEVVLPSGDTHTEQFNIPETWTDDSRLVRWLDSTGGSPAAIESLVGDECLVERGDNRWHLVVPAEDVSLVDRLKGRRPAEDYDTDQYRMGQATLLLDGFDTTMGGVGIILLVSGAFASGWMGVPLAAGALLCMTIVIGYGVKQAREARP